LNKDTVFEKLKEIFEDSFFDEFDFCDSLTADNVEDWDSLSHISLIVNIEKTFDVKFDTGTVMSLKNVGELVALIVSKKDS
jgi:acyl carrier protein